MDFSEKPKRKNPRKRANLISQLFFVWIVPLLWNGMKNGLTKKDLTKCLRKDRSDTLGDDLEREWKRELETAIKNKRKPKLWRALFRMRRCEMVILGIGRLSILMMRTVYSVILGQLLIQFQKPTVIDSVDTNVTALMNSDFHQINNSLSITSSDEVSMNFEPMDLYQFHHHIWNDAFSLATLMVLMIFISILLQHNCYLESNLYGNRLSIACCSLIYRKSLRLSASAASQTGAGHLVNLMSNDVARIRRANAFVHYIWILPVQSVIIGYLIWQRARWIALIGITCLLLKTVPVLTYLGHYRSVLQKNVAFRSDERIRIVNEIIQGIQVIKMYAWEIPFQKVVAEARRMEIQQIRYASYIENLGLSSYYFFGRSTLFIVILALFLNGQKITADIIFPFAQYFNILLLCAGVLYPKAISTSGAALVSMKRIEDFLFKEEKSDIDTDVGRRSSNISSVIKVNAVELHGVSASWDENSNSRTLSELDLKVKSGKICAVVGPVGSGKSSLIQLLLGELPVESGAVIVNGSISYAAQEPWIFSETVRNNILFGESYDRKRYNEIVKCCALTTDFKQLPNGDKTFVGDRGASLSGGQRARISLARAMYKTASIYLLDDPLSAVDAHVGKHLFDEVIGPNAQIAKNATRILVTHQVHLLKEADMIVIIENGHITHRGTYAELSNSDIDFAKFLDKEKSKKDEQIDDMLCEEEDIYGDNESKNDFDDMSNNAQYKPLKQRTESVSLLSMASQDFASNQIREEQQVKGTFFWRTCSKYFTVGSSRNQLLCLVFVLVSTQFAISGSDYYVKYLTYQESIEGPGAGSVLSQTEYLYIYGALIVCLIFICICRSISFCSACMRSSEALHDRMMDSLLHAPMRFFDLNQTGRILNRVSADIGTIDEVLPAALSDAIREIMNTCGIFIVIIMVNPAMIAVLLIGAVLFGLITKLYLRAAQDLKRLEGVCRSPVFSYVTATMNGLITIRTQNIDRKLCHEFDELQSVCSSVSHLSLASPYLFGLWMDMVGVLFTACVTYSSIFLFDHLRSANVGLVITQSMMLTNILQYGIRRLTDAMQQMTSVERIMEYAEMESEHSPTKTPPVEWPTNGNVKLQDMSLRYGPKNEPTLTDIRLEIQSGSKIGVVGRTGAGKSSLIAALFRLTHIEGLIEIDGVNTETISLASLRSKISIIPQDPVLFSGTLRRNLDPFEHHSDDDVWKALENVQMKDDVSLAMGLNMMVMANGSNFSVGQRQLLCLARAILRKNRILVLDEATANIDAQTDQLIQKTIRETFADCTVVTIAHRLHTIIDSDRVLVMDAGKCVEFDTPFNLLSMEKGIFKGMVEALGDAEYNRLYKLTSAERSK